MADLTESQATKVEQLLASLSKDDVTKLVSQLSTEIVGRFRQELIGENEDVLDRHLRKYRAIVTRRTNKIAQNWCKWSENGGPILMPDHTRLYYRRGNTEVMVLEYAPQVRFMRFRGSLARKDKQTDITEDESIKTYSYSLALPYLVFIMRFVDGMFAESYLAFNDRPLKTLQEKPLRPYLSNIDTSLKICHGVTLDKDKLIKGNLTQQAAYVLSHFWQTHYSDEWSTNYWESKDHFASDKRLCNLQAWQDASTENPLFVIEDVEWLAHKEENFGDMVVRMFDGDAETTRFHDELYEDLSNNFIEEVKTTLSENIVAISSKIEKMSTEQLAELLFQRLAALKD